MLREVHILTLNLKLMIKNTKFEADDRVIISQY